MPCGTWKFGRISELIQSGDGEIRSAKVKLKHNSTLRRSITLLYPLECGTREVKENSGGDGLNIDLDEEKKEDDTNSCLNVNSVRPTRRAMDIANTRLAQLLSWKCRGDHKDLE